jgi:hypothetical protein
MNEPRLPTMLAVGGVRLRAGVKMSLAQSTVDRLYDRYRKLESIVADVAAFRARLPEDLCRQIDEFYRLTGRGVE